MMPKEQHDFIKDIQDYMLIASNMDEHEAWDFGFRVWQFETWLYKYMTEDRDKADTPQTDCEDAFTKWQKSVADSYRPQTDCGWK